MARHCFACGAENEEEAAFCISCGQPLTTDQPAGAGPATGQPEASSPVPASFSVPPSQPSWPPPPSPVPSPAPPLSVTPSEGPVPTSVPNYLVPSILVTLCCCVPGGIASIIFAVQANNKAAAGDLVGGARDAKTALTIMLVSAGLGLLINLGLIGLQLLAAFANQ